MPFKGLRLYIATRSVLKLPFMMVVKFCSITKIKYPLYLQTEKRKPLKWDRKGYTDTKILPYFTQIFGRIVLKGTDKSQKSLHISDNWLLHTNIISAKNQKRSQFCDRCYKSDNLSK